MMRAQGMAVIAAIAAAAGCQNDDKVAHAPAVAPAPLPAATPAPPAPTPPPVTTIMPAAPSDPWLIVPGQSIGHIAIGMTQAEVEHALSKPSVTLTDGPITVMVWLGGPVRPHSEHARQTLPGFGDVRETAAALLENGKVFQIEVSSPSFHDASGTLSTAHTVRSMKRAHKARYRSDQTVLGNVDGEGTPAAHHVFGIEDDVAGGIAFVYGDWGDLVPDISTESEPEAIVVHTPGREMAIDPINTLPYAGHTAKSYTYKVSP